MTLGLTFFLTHLHIDIRILVWTLKKISLTLRYTPAKNSKSHQEPKLILQVSITMLNCQTKNEFKWQSFFGNILSRRIKDSDWLRKFWGHSVFHYGQIGGGTTLSIKKRPNVHSSVPSTKFYILPIKALPLPNVRNVTLIKSKT